MLCASGARMRKCTRRSASTRGHSGPITLDGARLVPGGKDCAGAWASAAAAKRGERAISRTRDRRFMPGISDLDEEALGRDLRKGPAAMLASGRRPALASFLP